LNFKRHFAALGAAVAIIILATAAQLFGDHLLLSFALYGALHALALSIAIAGQVPLKRPLFVVLAALLNVAVMYEGIYVFGALQVLAQSARLHTTLGLCAFSGALAYGFLIRGFWFNRFSPRRIAQLAIGCLIASQLALFATDFALVLGNWWFVTVWWFAYSAGLWIINRRTDALRPQADA
jgi:hypothetical protein